jgi:hypothetical protein
MDKEGNQLVSFRMPASKASALDLDFLEGTGK